jgi:hypothetical protein
MWGISESRGTIVVERRKDAPVRVSNDEEEFYEIIITY